ncbi:MULTISPECIES: hypothetical protein [Enterobacter cloacae complex]|jgi:hypothetical protein|uniref:hypothetical protein n=1 Tax=Enterobacter cloacae complex TaxID=354276 RepID=UPI000FB924A1|nr:MULTISPECIES: hypothetical protein [Enterobacter cloacae complex]EHS3054789.1 hypothetical protein [Salmonella enterica subsp. enterica serovar Typhimurium]ELS5684915.1 hypothetical protein [Enterobacter roggenkampii]EKK5411924.1 hypothetical protein [Enterobacter cloacae]EKV4775990.1 hypothetical protein [Enterobacter hormaechei]EKX4141973.1 hypothetical protein [Enterobacter cloacae]
MVIEARLFDKPVRQAKSLNGDYHAVRLTTLSIGRSMLSDGKALSEKSLKTVPVSFALSKMPICSSARSNVKISFENNHPIRVEADNSLWIQVNSG